MDKQKFLDYQTGLQLQKRELQSQLDKVEGALQLLTQLIEESEKEAQNEVPTQEG